MTLCYAGIVTHAPGITGRADLVQNTTVRDALYAAFQNQQREIEATQPDVLLLIAAEHFANFFMNNMPAFCIGTGETHSGPIEDPAWLKIPVRQNSPVGLFVRSCKPSMSPMRKSSSVIMA